MELNRLIIIPKFEAMNNERAFFLNIMLFYIFALRAAS